MKKLRRLKQRQNGSQKGIALFMVISALALLSILVAELTYSTQMNARLAYNYVDNLKAFYLSKAAMKLSMMRLKAYLQVRDFVNNPDNKQIKDSLDKKIIEKIWNMPFIFPLPIPKDASMSEGDTIKAFIKESKLSGTFIANITSESSKLNLNNLFITSVTPEPSPTPSPTPSPGSSPPPSTPPTPQKVDFRQLLDHTISNLIEKKKDEEREFADVYRNVNGKDVVDAIEAYLFPDKPPSNLPGFKQIKPKKAPMYSLTELHLIPGIDDELYNLLASALTVYSTPGLNINTMPKSTLQALIPELTNTELDDLMRKRDDPQVGQPWASDDDFWKDIGTTSASKNLDTIKKRFKDANVKIKTDEETFKVSIQANVGLSTRRLEMYLTLDSKALKKPKPGDPSTPDKTNPQAGGNPPGGNPPGQPPDSKDSQKDDASATTPIGLNLIYWRML